MITTIFMIMYRDFILFWFVVCNVPWIKPYRHTLEGCCWKKIFSSDLKAWSGIYCYYHDIAQSDACKILHLLSLSGYLSLKDFFFACEVTWIARQMLHFHSSEIKHNIIEWGIEMTKLFWIRFKMFWIQPFRQISAQFNYKKGYAWS